MSKFTIGCDPEFFLTKKDKVTSAIGVVHGTKRAPTILANGAGLQHDNVAVEFASPVASTLNEFIDSVEVSLGLIKDELPKQFGFAFEPSALFSKRELKHPKANDFGCEPDFNAWEEDINPIPKANNKNLRSCGGHIHIGYVEGSGNDFLRTIDGKLATAKMCDLILGIPSVVLDSTEASFKRRELYGKAGSHRPTPYGIEYRVLSNFWIKQRETIELVYYLVGDVLRLMRQGNYQQALNKVGEEYIREAIDCGDENLAMWVYNEYVYKSLSKGSKDTLTTLCGTDQGLYCWV